eukprot:symbB.v1.2.033630.t1/scaffold4207.1/size89611/1
MSAVVTYDEEQLCPIDSLSISARDKVCASEGAEASAGTYFDVSEATSNGGDAESGSDVIVLLARRSLPDLCGPRRWIPSSPFKTSMLWAGATMFPSRTVH